MTEFKLGDMVLYRAKGGDKDIWRPSVYVGIGKDGRLYFSDGGFLMPPENFEIVLLNEDTLQYLGSDKAIVKPWEPEPGELVAVKDEDDPYWRPVVYIKKGEKGEFVCGAYDNMEYNNRFTFSWELCEPIHKHFNISKCPEDA